MKQSTRDKKIDGILKADPDKEIDYHLVFVSNNFADFLQENRSRYVPQEAKFKSDWEFLRDNGFKISQCGLTERQMIAVGLVIMADLQKKTVAQIMGISYQAVTDHIVAGLKKVKAVLQGEKIKDRTWCRGDRMKMNKFKTEKINCIKKH